MGANGGADLQAALEQAGVQQVIGNDQSIDRTLHFAFGQQLCGAIDILGLDQLYFWVFSAQVFGQGVALGQGQLFTGQLFKA